METEKKFIEGFALSGEEVFNLKDKRFEIVECPFYETRTFEDKEKQKLVIRIKLTENGDVVNYYPNMTSQRVLVQSRGRDLSKWTGYKGIFKVSLQKIGKEDKHVIYIEDKLVAG